MPFYESYDPRDLHEKPYSWCVLCGQYWTSHEIHYTGASVTATVGETITGVTSGKTGTVASVSPYKTGGPEGTIVLTSAPTGDYTDGEAITGSTSGSSFATCQSYAPKKMGLGYPETALVMYEGKRYCRPHFKAYSQKIKDKAIPDVRDVTWSR